MFHFRINSVPNVQNVDVVLWPNPVYFAKSIHTITLIHKFFSYVLYIVFLDMFYSF